VSRLSKYAAACSAAYYQVSTELAASKNVEMERAKSELEEHRFVCAWAKFESHGQIFRKAEGM
jgi:hypothetical protein